MRSPPKALCSEIAGFSTMTTSKSLLNGEAKLGSRAKSNSWKERAPSLNQTLTLSCSSLMKQPHSQQGTGHAPNVAERGSMNSRAAWIEANRELIQGENPTIADIDKVIHAERVTEEKRKRTFVAQLGSLPAGTMIAVEGTPLLVWRGKLLPWSFEGYGKSQTLLAAINVGSSTHACIRGSGVCVGFHAASPFVRIQLGR
jgi:hypothetical protein